MKNSTEHKDRVKNRAIWHKNIAEELGKPVVPESQETQEETLRAIETQRERHELFARALRKLAATA